eukprot:NODE_7236_length_454_cov_10.819572_g7070_i0.p1 GENE.NODE_7236_length_454_cov_10.819572_g7070_i0~~NODE_7236_length_454_cov_10.819572_g7070_i0.p1  ORF type:complete len:120 (+),score=26.66 NODE_7236_length_454_cov_10.819572_g7070_i0:43-402(+)
MVDAVETDFDANQSPPRKVQKTVALPEDSSLVSKARTQLAEQLEQFDAVEAHFIEQVQNLVSTMLQQIRNCKEGRVRRLEQTCAELNDIAAENAENQQQLDDTRAETQGLLQCVANTVG